LRPVPARKIPSSLPQFITLVRVGTLRLWRRWRRELGQISESKRGFDAADPLLGIIESIFAEHFVLDVLELVADLVELLVGEILFPRRKDPNRMT
jgi:hypothetical protein